MSVQNAKVNEELIGKVEDFVGSKDLIEKVKKLKKSSFNPIKNWQAFKETINTVVDVVEKAVVAVEKVSKTLSKVLDGQTKLDAVAVFLDKLIILPWPLELVDKQIFKLLISFVVNAINERAKNHDWKASGLI